MPGYVLAAVLFAALLHASWNALAKGRATGADAGDPLVRAAMIAAGGAVAALPLIAYGGIPASASWPHLVASIVIHVIYFILVGMTLRGADLGVVYPLTRGSAPLGTALAGYLLIGDALTAAGWAGVLVLGAGIVTLGSDALRRRGLDARSAGLVALNASVIVAYTLIDGAGVRLSGDPAGYIGWLMFGTGAGLYPVVSALHPDAFRQEMRARWRFGLAGGAMLTASYGIALWAMTKAPIAAVSAARETSVLFAAIIGAVFLGERLGHAGLAGAALIGAGLVLLRLA